MVLLGTQRIRLTFRLVGNKLAMEDAITFSEAWSKAGMSIRPLPTTSKSAGISYPGFRSQHRKVERGLRKLGVM